MKKEDRSSRMFLEDIQIAMGRIAEYIEGHDFAQFKKDYKTVDAVIRNFEIIGEASKSLSEEIIRKSIKIFHGRRCIILGTGFRMNILVLIMK